MADDPQAKPEKKTQKKAAVPPGTKREFIRRQLIANPTFSNDDIIANWEATYRGVELKEQVVKRERTLFDRLNEYDVQLGLQDFFSSQATLLLEQYQNIEQLLGPPDSDWVWVGEHCEVLLRNAIRRHLPPSLAMGKGYIHGARKGPAGIERCPELDIVVYDQERFAPLFSMGDFVILHPDSVVAAIQVKRTLDANTLAKAVNNVVAAKQHVRDTSRLNSSSNTERMFGAVVTYEEGIDKKSENELSASYTSALQPHIDKYHDGFVLPDFVGSLSKMFLVFTGLNANAMGYQAFPSEDDDGRNVALAVLLFLLIRKIRPFGTHLPPAFPEKMKVRDYIELWKKPTNPAGDATDA